jgi:hypothetical protein
MTIKATLDLKESSQHFLTTVTSLLEATQVADLDGVKVKKVEEKIIESALILAGQCIALFLFNLSQLPEVQETAESKTKGWWRNQTVKNGLVERTILTIGNVAVSLKLPYVVERHDSKTQKKSQKKARHQGFCPFLRWLGMEEGVTPHVWSTIALYGTLSHSFETAREILKNWGLKISLRRLERLTYVFGRRGLNQRNIKVNRSRRGEIQSEEEQRKKVGL